MSTLNLSSYSYTRLPKSHPSLCEKASWPPFLLQMAELLGFSDEHIHFGSRLSRRLWQDTWSRWAPFGSNHRYRIQWKREIQIQISHRCLGMKKCRCVCLFLTMRQRVKTWRNMAYLQLFLGCVSNSGFFSSLYSLLQNPEQRTAVALEKKNFL